MKKLLLSVAVLAMVCGTADAQSLLQRLGDKAKEAAEKNLGEKIEKGVNNALDGKSKKNKGKKGKEVVEEEAQEVAAEKTIAVEAWTCEECGKTGNTGKFCDDCGASLSTVSGSARSFTNCFSIPRSF